MAFLLFILYSLFSFPQTTYIDAIEIDPVLSISAATDEPAARLRIFSCLYERMSWKEIGHSLQRHARNKKIKQGMEGSCGGAVKAGRSSE